MEEYLEHWFWISEFVETRTGDFSKILITEHVVQVEMKLGVRRCGCL